MSISSGFPSRIPIASQKASGLMSSSDKIKLDNINPGDILASKEEIDKLKDTITPTKIYGIAINMSNSDPYTCVTYTDDAINFSPLFVNQITSECNYGSWKEIIDSTFKPKPVLVKDGNVVMYLDENNFARNIYGVGVDINSGAAGDVMIEFSKIYYKLEKTGDIINFKISTKKIDETWTCDAFLSENGLYEECDHIYIGAYESTVDEDGKLRSLSGYVPTANNPISQFRGYAENNGINYKQMNFVKRELISFLTIMVTKTLDVQSKIGKGVSQLEWTGNNNAIKTGTMNTNGLFYGESTGKQGIKVFGIENFWGNLNEFVEGLIRNESTLYYKKAGPYNDTGSGYNLAGELPLSKGGWIKSKDIIDGIISVPSEYDASSNTYFSDYCYMPDLDDLICIGTAGGSFFNNLSCGVSCIDLRSEPGTVNQSIGSRLVCTEKEE